MYYLLVIKSITWSARTGYIDSYLIGSVIVGNVREGAITGTCRMIRPGVFFGNNTTTPGGVDATRYLYVPYREPNREVLYRE